VALPRTLRSGTGAATAGFSFHLVLYGVSPDADVDSESACSSHLASLHSVMHLRNCLNAVYSGLISSARQVAST
jgi:hypothetical protein